MIRTFVENNSPYPLQKNTDVVFFDDGNRWVGDLSRPLRMFDFGEHYPRELIDRCPIFRALSPTLKLELLMRAPKPWDRKDLLDTALEDYEKSESRGISPLTAMGLLCPSSWYVWHTKALAPQCVSPAPVRFFDEKEQRFVARQTLAWHVIIWALKMYGRFSWADLQDLHPALEKKKALRQTILRMVEQPLNGYYTLGNFAFEFQAIGPRVCDHIAVSVLHDNVNWLALYQNEPIACRKRILLFSVWELSIL